MRIYNDSIFIDVFIYIYVVTILKNYYFFSH